MTTKTRGSSVQLPLNATTLDLTIPSNLHVPTGKGIGVGGGTPVANTLDFGTASPGIVSVGGMPLFEFDSTPALKTVVPFFVQNSTAAIYAGTGAPEGNITASPGSIYLNSSGGKSVSVYIKESGATSSGWKRIFTDSYPSLNPSRTTDSTVGSSTLVATNMVAGYIKRTGPVGAYNITTDTAAAIIAALPGAVIGSSFELTIINTVAFIGTVLAGSGVSLVGTTAIAASTWRKYLCTVVDTVTPAVSLEGLGAGTL